MKRWAILASTFIFLFAAHTTPSWAKYWAKVFVTKGFEGYYRANLSSIDNSLIILGSTTYTDNDGYTKTEAMSLHLDQDINLKNAFRIPAYSTSLQAPCGSKFLDRLPYTKNDQEGEYPARLGVFRILCPNQPQGSTFIIQELNLSDPSTLTNVTFQKGYTFQDINIDLVSTRRLEDTNFLMVTSDNTSNPPRSIISKYNSQGEYISGSGIKMNNVYLRRLIVDDSGGYVLTGHVLENNQMDIIVIKFDSKGDIVWSKRYGTSSTNEYGRSINPTANGYILAGHTFSSDTSSDILALGLDKSGNIVWQKVYKGAKWDGTVWIDKLDDGDHLISGSTYSFGGGDSDGFVMKINTEGNILWAKTYGGIKDEYVVAFHGFNNIWIAAETNSFGTGEKDILVISADSNGNVGNCFLINDITFEVGTLELSYSELNPVAVYVDPVPVTDVTISLNTWSPKVTTLCAYEPALCTLRVVKKGLGGGRVVSSPSGIDCGTQCTATIQPEQTVTLTAEAYTGSTFTGWSGGASSSQPHLELTLKEDMEIIANYKYVLQPNWNLVGLHLPEPISVSQLFAGKMEKIKSVWKWVKQEEGLPTWAVYLPKSGSAASESYANQKGFKLLETIYPGEGFWVNAELGPGETLLIE